MGLKRPNEFLVVTETSTTILVKKRLDMKEFMVVLLLVHVTVKEDYLSIYSQPVFFGAKHVVQESTKGNLPLWECCDTDLLHQTG